MIGLVGGGSELAGGVVRFCGCCDSEGRVVGRTSESFNVFDDVAAVVFIIWTLKEVTFGSEDNSIRWKFFALFGSKNMFGA